MVRVHRINAHLIGVITLAVVIFFAALFGLAAYVDGLALQREKAQLGNAVAGTLEEASERITPLSNWDDAVRHLDNHFDRAWTVTSIGQYFCESDALPVSYVLDGADHPIFGMVDDRSVTPASFQRFAPKAAALIARVRAMERRRGPFRPPFRAIGDISRAIQASAIMASGGRFYMVIASLVQPDAGNALPRGPRAPIIVNAKEIDAALLHRLGERLLVTDLHVASPGERDDAAIELKDADGGIAGRLAWSPARPGAYLISVAFLPILLAVGLPLGFYLRSRMTSQKLARALNELSRARERAVAARRAAEAASRAKSQFLANMSHELRTPLNAVIGFSELLLSETLGPLGHPRYREYLTDIHGSGNHLLALINDVLDLSRLDAGEGKLHEERTAPAELLELAVRTIAPQAANAGVRLTSDVEPNLPDMMLDARRLYQVLLNILSNAVKFTPGAGSVHAAMARDGEGLRIRISDTGIGIAEKDMARVLERFGQVEDDFARKYIGAGLGIPLSKQFVELHGGRLTLESELHVGTTVTVLLPAARFLPPEVEAAA
jgi:signal transduction histidine kinase